MDKMQNAFKIADLVTKRLEGKLSHEEHIALEKWKHEKEENLVLFYKIAQNPEKQYFDRAVIREKSNKEEVWNRVRKDIHRKRFQGIGRELLKYAASLLIIASGIFFLNRQVFVEEASDQLAILPGKNQALLVTGQGEKISLDKPVRLSESGVEINNDTKELIYEKSTRKDEIRKPVYNTIIVPKGGEYKLTLVDGTKIWLNSNSKLRYPSGFTGEIRKVSLEGEAYFKVAHDALHPFIVEVDDYKVKVLGTSFNVNAYKGKSDVVTTLVEGKVKFEDDQRDQYSFLTPGEQLRMNKNNGDFQKTHVDVRLYTAWKDGRFVFENETLENIMERLSRWYNVEVFFLNNDAKSMRFCGDLARYEDVSQILEMLEVTQKVTFTVQNNGIVVEKN